MGYLQNGIEHLNQWFRYSRLAILFLIASIAGWYVGICVIAPPMTTTATGRCKGLSRVYAADQISQFRSDGNKRYNLSMISHSQ